MADGIDDMPPMLEAAYRYVWGIDASFGAKFSGFQMALAFEAGAMWERERCAAIADRHFDAITGKPEFENLHQMGEATAAESIAIAIRNQERQ